LSGPQDRGMDDTLNYPSRLTIQADILLGA
jgi:hypothetical protein